MDINFLSSKFSNFVKLTQKNANTIKIESNAKFLNGKSIDLCIVENNDKIYITDNKCTLRYMNEYYELKSEDVKSCIASVLKIYNFSLVGGEIHANVSSIVMLENVFFNIIMCISQLANMFAFFEKPE